MSLSSLTKYHYNGGKKYSTLRNTAVFIASIPENIKLMAYYKTFNLHKILNKPPASTKHKGKNRFQQFIPKKRNALLILTRYDHSQNKSLVEIVDLNNFEVLHNYQLDPLELWKEIKNTKEFPTIKISHSPIRFEYFHPIILDDGSLIADSNETPIFKINFCSNLEWINDEEIFHHSKMLDHEKNIWSPGNLNPKSKYIKKFISESFNDDSIIKINLDGKILFNKSVIEILIENKIFPDNFALNSDLMNSRDPIHLNDIEPVLEDNNYWNKGDIFLSIRNQSAIIHYRPSTNKVINYITGPFSWQHDVDIISDKEISIFNNNVVKKNNFSEILIYNFETLKFTKLFNNQLKNENFKTTTNGLSHLFKDGSLMVEETIHGRILLFNNEGEKEWEYINKDMNGDIGKLSWTRIVEDDSFVDKFKLLVKNKKCVS
jgi:hypothetical protein